SKLWPRLDNFKQHLIRMHPAEDVEALVKKSEQWHAEEEGDGMSQGPDAHTQDSVINSLQNVKRLRSPPRPLGAGPAQLRGDRPLSRRWDLTPPTPAAAANQDRRTDLRQILTEPGRQPLSNGERPLQPTPAPAMHPPPPPPSAAPNPSHPNPNPNPPPNPLPNTPPSTTNHASNPPPTPASRTHPSSASCRQKPAVAPASGKTGAATSTNPIRGTA
ncbi:MAG: hypothetical protein M1823_006400, partial [Watsoniomyces obsoletus]